MANTTITTEGIYTKGVVIPKLKPNGKRSAIITFLPPSGIEAKTDEKIWQEISPLMHRIREKLVHQRYPQLFKKYAQKKGKA